MASTAVDIQLLRDLWRQLRMPETALSAISIRNPTWMPRDAFQLPSSFRVNDLATASIGLFHLAAAQYCAFTTRSEIRPVTVSRLGASLEFRSETHFTINGKPLDFPQYFGGLHATKDGSVRIHDGFEIHREGARQILGLANNARNDDVAAACAQRMALDLEAAAFKTHAVIGAMRTSSEWYESGPGRAVPEFPIAIDCLDTHTKEDFHGPIAPNATFGEPSRCLAGVKVLELSRVIAAPVAGRALASHGADVLWVTCPNLEDQPYLDRDLARGKRSIRLDLNTSEDSSFLKELVREADVFVQGYRPNSLAKRGFSPHELFKLNPRLIYASLSAYPTREMNPWQFNRGFDSIVQTCSGLNVAEAESFNEICPPDARLKAKALPCQALDHASGFLLASGIVTAMCRRMHGEGGQLVEVSLASTSRLLSSLPRLEARDGFEGKRSTRRIDEVLHAYGSDAEVLFDEADSEFGRMKFVKPAGHVEGMYVGWKRMPRPLGSDQPKWLRQT